MKPGGPLLHGWQQRRGTDVTKVLRGAGSGKAVHSISSGGSAREDLARGTEPKG